jgi:hypothetical protein
MTVVKMSTWSKLERMGYILRSTTKAYKTNAPGSRSRGNYGFVHGGGHQINPRLCPQCWGFLSDGGVQANSQDARLIEPLHSCTLGPKAQQEHIIECIREALINIGHTPRLLEHGGLGWVVVVGNRNNAPVFPVWGTHAQPSRKSCVGTWFSCTTHTHTSTHRHTHARMHAQENLSCIDVEHGPRTRHALKTFRL